MLEKPTHGVSKVKASGHKVQKLEHKCTIVVRQVIVSALIFLVIFAGGRLLPAKVFDLYNTINQVITDDHTQLTSIEVMGQALEEGKPWREAVQAWCTETFLSGRDTPEGETELFLKHSSIYHKNLIPRGPYHPEQPVFERQS